MIKYYLISFLILLAVNIVLFVAFFLLDFWDSRCNYSWDISNSFFNALEAAFEVSIKVLIVSIAAFFITAIVSGTIMYLCR